MSNTRSNIAVGHCGTTTAAPRDCSSRSFGAFQPLSNLEVRTWRSAERSCVERCRRCANCRYVSFSRQFRDCSWYETCDLENLHKDVDGFQSRRVHQDTEIAESISPSNASPHRLRSRARQHSIDLDEPGGVRRAIRAVNPPSLSSRTIPEVILVTANENGLGNARRVSDSLMLVGAPEPLILAPRAAVCAAARGRPCSHSTRGSMISTGTPTTTMTAEWCVLLRLRQAFLSLFYAAGANVMQLDSDVAFFSNPLDALHGALRSAALVAQWDHPVANSGFVHAKHVSNESDRVIRFVLSEWSNRMWHHSAVGRIAPAFMGHGTSASSADVRCPNDQAVFNDLLVGFSSGAFRYNQGFVVPDARRELKSDRDSTWDGLIRLLTAGAHEPNRAFEISGAPGEPSRAARPVSLRTWDEKRDYWTSAMAHEVWSHHERQRLETPLTWAGSPMIETDKGDEDCHPPRPSASRRMNGLVIRVPSPTAFDPLSHVAGIEAAIEGADSSTTCSGPPLGHDHRCPPPSTVASLLPQEPPSTLASLRAVYAAAPSWLMSHWSPEIIEQRAMCAARRPRTHTHAAARRGCAEPVSAVHLAAFFYKAVRGLILEGISNRPPAHCNTSSLHGGSGSGGAKLLRVPHDLIGPALRSNATLYVRLMRQIARLGMGSGRHVPIPRLPLGTRWAFDSPPGRGGEAPSAVTTGCVAEKTLRLWWLPLALTGGDAFDVFKHAKRWLFDRCEHNDEAVLDLSARPLRLGPAARAARDELARLSESRVVRVHSTSETRLLEWLVAAERS